MTFQVQFKGSVGVAYVFVFFMCVLVKVGTERCLLTDKLILRKVK